MEGSFCLQSISASNIKWGSYFGGGSGRTPTEEGVAQERHTYLQRSDCPPPILVGTEANRRILGGCQFLPVSIHTSGFFPNKSKIVTNLWKCLTSVLSEPETLKVTGMCSSGVLRSCFSSSLKKRICNPMRGRSEKVLTG